ncbi:YhdP family protein [Candidatus Vallotiella sp. (ex Adelges kitamiensis)]|uniref:YhdP family protein n=1 Tax=Candidatus Vallotiella sp. (ex Adelges kitamiensis) TaxID=2864217 RepID=UPI001CE301A3|nr:YhdP family protein [Candidatus Vallotia sp. (ex Adelges kitamiensis)]
MLDRHEKFDSQDSRNTKSGSRWLNWPNDRILRRILGFCTILAITLYFGAAAIYLSLRYVIFPRLDSMRPYIERCISDTLHAPVHIGKLTGRWSGFQPTIEIYKLTIIGLDGQRMLEVPNASATLSWRSLTRLEPVFSSLIVEQPDIFIERHTDGTYTIAGVRVDPHQHSNSAILRWLMMQRIILLRGGVLHWINAPRGLPTLTCRNICVVIKNHSLSHQLSVQAQPDGHFLRGPISFRAQFYHSPLKMLAEPAGWSGTIFASSKSIALHELIRYTGTCLNVQSGMLNAVAWLNFSDGKWRGARGVLSGSELRLCIDPTLPQLDVPSVRLDWSLHHSNIHNIDYTLNLGNVRIEVGGQIPLPDGTPITRLLSIGRFNAQFRRATLSRGQLIGISGDAIDLGVLTHFLRTLPLPHRILNELERFDPHGTLANYEIQIEHRAPHSQEAARIAKISSSEPIIRYRINAELEGVSFSAQDPLPGAENIWGKVSADQNGGYAMINTTNAVVSIPAEFENPRLTFKRFIAEATWTARALAADLSRPAITVNISRLILDNQDLCASARGIYSNPGHGYGKLDMEAIFDRLLLSRLARYLPTRISKHTRSYLNHALKAGTVRNAKISIHGELSKFPYIRNSQAGVFKIVVPFQNGSFDPTPSFQNQIRKDMPEIWPTFDGIDGLFWMSQNILHLDIQRARYQRVTLAQLTGHINDLAALDSDLVIDGVASGSLADMLNYVNHSSLAVLFNHPGKLVRAKGNATLALRLSIPLHLNRTHIRVNGSLSLAHDTVSFVSGKQLSVIPPITQIHGKVDFTENTVTIRHITGQFLGGNICANGCIQGDKSGSFSVSGHLCTNAIQAIALPRPVSTLLTRVSGCVPYSVTVHTYKNKLPYISVTSDLRGLALQLPAPFMKPAGAPMSFLLSLRPAVMGKQRMTDISRLDAQLGLLNLTYLVRRVNNKPIIMHGMITINKKEILSRKGGTTVTADIAYFDADAWRALFDSLSIPTNAISTDPVSTVLFTHPTSACVGSALRVPDMATSLNLLGNIKSLVPTRISLHLGTLKLLNRHWKNIVINATGKLGVWRVRIVSGMVSGYITWHSQTPNNPYGQIVARLDKLVIPNSCEPMLGSPRLEEPARYLPSIDLIINECTVRKHNLGKIKVNAHNIDEKGAPVWKLDQLDAINPAARLSIIATTSRITQGTTGCTNIDSHNNLWRTAVNFKLNIADGGTLLDCLGLPRTLKGSSGELSGSINWQGRLMQINYATLNGKLLLRLMHGQILKVDPGAVKLLSVLSLQSLTRLAMLDLNALFGAGLPFNNISTTSTIKNGIVRSDNFALKSAFAKITLHGNIDLEREQQDLLMTVTPSLSLDTVALATAAVNPLLGLGTLVASLVLSEPISQSFARHYTVTGSWSHPRVKQLLKDHGKIKNIEPYSS